MGEKRPISMTNSEISMTFFIIGTIMFLVAFRSIMILYFQVPLTDFVIIMFLLIIAIVFFAMSMVLPNYLISKHNLNLLIDRISNPDWIGWIRFTRSKQLRFQIVKKGPLGQTKGVANDAKADIINDGMYTVTTPCGNQAIIKNDLLSTNIDLLQATKWQMMKDHHFLVGYQAWEKCNEDGETVFELKESTDGEIRTKERNK